MSEKFLTGVALTNKIRKVMAEKNPRMCVAFLGPKWIREIFGDAAPDDLRVVCDLQMRMTSQAALIAGGAPDNDRLRYLPKTEMHAKVYLSEKGAVICSANASSRALSSANRIEDGIWISHRSSAYSQVKKEFKKRYKQAKLVDKIALDAAPEHVGELLGGKVGLPEGITLIEALRCHRDKFHGIRFVCSTNNVDKKIREAANERLNQEADEVVGPENRRQLDHFSNWYKEEGNWPALFFSIHRGPQGGFSLTKHRHHQFLTGVEGESGTEPEDVFVSHKIRWDAAGAAFGDMPRLASHALCQDQLRNMFTSEERFRNYFAGRIFTGTEFADLLFQGN